MTIGDVVRVKVGATDWLKAHDHWDDYITDIIDGLTGTIEDDYRSLPGDDSHLCVNLGFESHVGLPEHMLELQSNV